VVVLTNRAADFFTRANYALSDLDALPEKRREQFIASGRDSLVFQKFI
jgi:N-acetylglutamate synthase-like GNAT family acetyltransferase